MYPLQYGLRKERTCYIYDDIDSIMTVVSRNHQLPHCQDHIKETNILVAQYGALEAGAVQTIQFQTRLLM